MVHQVEVEKTKYRDWVRGGLAYKYLKQGIEGFADDVVLQEHKRIIQNIKITPGQPCTQCSIGSLKPQHASACPRGQSNCSCLNRKKKICPNRVCDVIMGDILDSHGSQPPAPYWKNADIQKWCSDPWEVAKCFINAPGYADKTSASEIDASGLLHVFINNTKLHSHLSCAISTNGTDVFSKVRKRRNQIFHSPTMEMNQNDLNDCIADIITLLEDAKELRQRPEAKAAVEKLTQLNQNSFVITTNNEVEVCRDAVVSVANISEELKQAMNERLKHVETENATLKKDISLIKQQLFNPEEQDTTRNKHKKQLEYEEKKQALQRSLVERYETKGYFKTWVSPLITQQNNIAVNEIYVTPNMEIEEKADELSSKGHSSSDNRIPPKKVDGYRDIFQTDGARHKKIYIIGDVGTGKSTLSKMMIFNWCRAISGESKERENIDKKCNECHSEENTTVVLSDDEGKNNGKCEQDNPTDSDNTSYTSPSWEGEQISAVNIREMSKFYFLFTIHLQGMSGFRNIMEMLKALYNPNKDAKTDDLMNDIFNKESERCLIIADGLDEWTPPKYAPSPQHVSYGIPVGDGVNNATLVTLSRPSAKGILNMKLTEYDQKIKLLGVHTTSVYDFVSKYMELNGKKDKEDEDDFIMKIRQTYIEHLEETPLILQQLVWMYCTHGDIGNSVADIYSNIVNIIFGWFENKGEEDITQPSENTDRECEQMQLPELLRRFPRCEQNKRILLPLGKLAFKACDEDGKSTFGRSGCGLSKYDTDTLIKCGVLVEHNCINPTIQKSSLSFIHISYLEFFAAVYISSNYRERYPTPKKKPKLQSRMVLNKLFKKIKSVEDILRLSNILRMVCGLSPFLLEEISKLISKQLMSDESMIRYRNDFSQQSDSYMDDDEADLIQDLISNCLLECGRDDKPAISLCDVVTTWEPDHPFLTNIVTESVVSVNINLSELTTARMVEIMKLVSKFYQSQFIQIYGIRSCEACKHLSSFLSQAVSLKQLRLSNICCDRDECEGHTIDLSNHNQLNGLVIDDSSLCLLESVVNTKSLDSVSITQLMDHTPHGICEHLSSWLTQAVSLKQLTLRVCCDRGNCEGHAIDLSKHDELQSINIVSNFFISQAIINTKSLHNVSISNRNDHKTPHGICEHLSSSLSQAVSIERLELSNITCDRDDCEGHAIDLSKHDHIQSIDLNGFSFTLGSMAIAERLERVSISGSSNRRTSHAVCEHLSSSLSQAVSIQWLKLSNITCDRDDCEGHVINLSKYDQTQIINLNACSLTLGSMANAKSLKTVSISESYNGRTSHAMCEHLSSSLSQAVSIQWLKLSNITCDRDDCEGHVINLSKYDQTQIINLNACSLTLGSMANAKSLKTVSISESYNGRTSHAMCEQLSSSLSQAVSIERLELSNITCDRDNCEGHAIDLSKHDKVQSINLVGCSLTLGSMANAKRLKTVSISGRFKREMSHAICEFMSIACDRDACKGYAIDLSKHDNIRLYNVFISNRNYHKTPHGICEHLSSSLSQAVFVEELQLRHINCDRDDCNGHVIDLSKHDNLRSINLHACSLTLGSMENAKSLKTVSISGCSDRRTSHAMCEQLSSSLSQAVSIERLELSNITCDRDDCEGHVINLSKYDQTQIINLNACSLTLGSMANAKSLKTVSISGSSYRRTSHAMCEQLSSSLSQAVSIERLELSNITCDRDDCEGHVINLSKYDQTQIINLNACSLTLGSMANAKSLKTVSISGSYNGRTSHAMCEQLSSSLSQAVSIERLELSNITCDRDDCEGHAIDLSKHDHIQSIGLNGCSLTLGSMANAERLERVSISGSSNRRTLHAVCEHLSSSLSQAVSIQWFKLSNITCDRDDCEGHAIDLSKHDKLQSINLVGWSLT